MKLHFQAAMERAERGAELDPDDLLAMLACESEEDMSRLFRVAYSIKSRHVGRRVFFRGLIEFSNICGKNCSYCGLRRENVCVKRFTMPAEAIAAAARWADQHDFGSVVLQSGERQDDEFVAFVEDVVQRITQESAGRLGITLSVGEQTEAVYRRWHEAGAHRYLLRIEDSNPEVYRRLHPAGHDFETRRDCLRRLKRMGYQVGTGVLIGAPYQTPADLVRGILFFKELDVDMIGMGPYIPHDDTPLGRNADAFDARRNFLLGLKMIAATRIYLRDVNIAAATALQALDPQGREMGLMAGANVVMPNVTDKQYRQAYELYRGKPQFDETRQAYLENLVRNIEAIGEDVGFGRRGDAPHFSRRMGSA